MDSIALPSKTPSIITGATRIGAPAEMDQAHIRDLTRGECEPIPGVTLSASYSANWRW